MKRVWAASIVLFVFATHIAMTGLYLLPANPLSPFYVPFVKKYMEPLFQQSWQLFAPEPATFSIKFWYRCGDDSGKTTPWLDPSKSFMEIHQRWRIGPQGKILYIPTGIARGVINEYVTISKQLCSEEERKSQESCLTKASSALSKKEYYQAARKMASQECQKYSENNTLSTIDWIQFQAVKLRPVQFSERKKEVAFKSMEYFKSPPIKI